MAEGAGAARRFDVAEFIDDRPIGTREIFTLVVCSMVLFMDGFDMYFLGKILPAIAEGLGGTPVDMQPVVTYQQIGMLIGAIAIPPLADKMGRKPVLALCLLGFGGLTLWAAWAGGFTMLAWLRGIAGVFFSAMLPVGLAIISEATPKRRRALFMSIALVCFSGGNLGSGFMVTLLLEPYGWEIFFIIGGVVPLVAMLLLLAIPESLAFRVNRDPKDPMIPRTLRRIEPGIVLKGNEEFHMGDQGEVEKLGPLAMFGPRFRVQTVLLFAICFFSLGNIALLANWLATYMLEMRGVPLTDFAFYMIIGYFGGATGTLCMGWLMDRVNPYKVLAVYFVVDAIAIASIGQLDASVATILVTALIVWNFCQVGGQTGINNLATLGYPPEMRSSGMGWAGAMGRFGGVVFPALGGMALAASLDLETIMFAAAMPAVVIAILITILGVYNHGKIGGLAMQAPDKVAAPA